MGKKVVSCVQMIRLLNTIVVVNRCSISATSEYASTKLRPSKRPSLRLLCFDLHVPYLRCGGSFPCRIRGGRGTTRTGQGGEVWFGPVRLDSVRQASPSTEWRCVRYEENVHVVLVRDGVGCDCSTVPGFKDSAFIDMAKVLFNLGNCLDYPGRLPGTSYISFENIHPSKLPG